MSSGKNVKELSLRSIVLGAILSVVMGAANVYLGLKVGITITASIPAAVVAALFLRGIFKDGTIFESNQVQTAASAGEALAAGIIFTIPAFLMIGAWETFNFYTTTLIAIAGGILGVLFMIPMRKVFIVGDFKDLPYPEAKATAAVLEASHTSDVQGKKQGWSLIYGTLIGGLFQFIIGFVGLFKSAIEHAFSVFNRVFYFGADLSPALMGVGFIIGLNIAAQVFAGGVIGWLIILPALSSGSISDASLLDTAWQLWATKTRYVGVGALIIGGGASIFFARAGFKNAVLEIKQLLNKTEKGVVLDTERDISAKSIVLLSVLCISALILTYQTFTKDAGVTAIAAIVMVVLAFFFTAVANYIVAIVGNSNSPVSGMNISALLASGLLLVLFGYSGLSGMAASLGVAAVICCVAAVAGDSCNDLKTGHLIGASPFRQQIMQIVGVVIAAISMAPVLTLLHENTPGGIGGRELSAPQASLLASLARGLFDSNTALPWDMIVLGMGIGIVILILELIGNRQNWGFKIHVMPLAVGIYLPFELTLPMLFGGFVNYMFSKGFSGKEKEKRTRRGVLFGSGFIAGESLMGVAIALLASLGIKRMDLGLSDATHTTLTILGLITMAIIFIYNVRPKEEKA